MAETVLEELERKLVGCQNAIAETTLLINKCTAELELLTQRESDLKKAMSGFKTLKDEVDTL